MTFMASTVTAIVDSLKASPAVSAQVDRVRMRPLAATVESAVVVRPLQFDVQQQQAVAAPGYPVSWTGQVAVECYMRSNGASPADGAVDALLASVYARLMQDTTLGGVVLALQPQGIAYDFDADGSQSTCATLIFTTRHRTAGNTLT